MAKKEFDQFDFWVLQAHSLVENTDGGASFFQLKKIHWAHLPQQRVNGLVRRGLMRYEGGYYFVTTAGSTAYDRYLAAWSAANASTSTEKP